ncbi:sugar ABC transporter substrate-binding protein [Streptomyces nojiriensis]|uniref:Sugar ABC transporter substrate-binding protein n=1 Tax=Streptomyces nojiriensis TaxID=66374 RepID=A0ABQ3SUG4_9ACTN|nr:extracellular solute-binding protein [Streptomyces nojiriensis]QTI45128.1 Maltose-binding periplasmic protein [Streptomyces nojiriensis]GGR93920.1 sugar ABC transporter substrate-binding protein [Streptomyces nojiriensis]GHI71582.1 sugar ABC transporter substrate-binding protein [Streptomyces nojiriensis]
MRRGIAATALVATLALAATACGGDDKNAADGTKAGGELSGTVTWWDTSNDAEKASFQKIAEAFTAKHPKVTVKYVNVPYGDAQNKVKNAFSSGSDAPDVIRADVGWVADFASLGYLDEVPADQAKKIDAEFLPQAAASGKFEGKTYAVPQVIDSLGLFYNKKMLADAGVQPPKTLEEVKTAAAAIKGKTGKAGLYLRGDDSYWFLPLIYGEGGDLVDAKNKTVTVDNEAGVKAFKTARDLVASGAAITNATDGYANMQTAFKTGEAAMMINGPWAVADTYAGDQFKDKANLGIAAVPAGSAKAGAPQGGHDLAVYAGSKNTAAAHAFVEYMTSQEVQVQSTKDLSLLPTRTAAYELPDVKGNEMVQFFKPAVDKAVERAWIPENGSLFEPLKVEYTKAITGASSPEDAAKSAGVEFRKILKGWK